MFVTRICVRVCACGCGRVCIRVRHVSMRVSTCLACRVRVRVRCAWSRVLPAGQHAAEEPSVGRFVLLPRHLGYGGGAGVGSRQQLFGGFGANDGGIECVVRQLPQGQTHAAGAAACGLGALGGGRREPAFLVLGQHTLRRRCGRGRRRRGCRDRGGGGCWAAATRARVIRATDTLLCTRRRRRRWLVPWKRRRLLAPLLLLLPLLWSDRTNGAPHPLPAMFSSRETKLGARHGEVRGEGSTGPADCASTAGHPARLRQVCLVYPRV